MLLMEKELAQPTVKSLRPTKKQRQLLEFIAGFIKQHGYSPSYREIMNGCGYTSVATVSLHVNNLISRGHLRKRDHSARSLEVVGGLEDSDINVNRLTESEEKWLVLKVEWFFRQAEVNPSTVAPEKIDEQRCLDSPRLEIGRAHV